jgi:hypothetical protein
MELVIRAILTRLPDTNIIKMIAGIAFHRLLHKMHERFCPALQYAPGNEDELKSGDTGSRILTLGAR